MGVDVGSRGWRVVGVCAGCCIKLNATVVVVVCVGWWVYVWGGVCGVGACVRGEFCMCGSIVHRNVP